MENNELQHHGIKGMKWGVRRYQNRDGTLTKAGKKRYDKEMAKLKEEEKKVKNKARTQAKIDKLLQKQQDVEEAKRRLDPEYRKALENKEKGIINKATKPGKTKKLSDAELKQEYNRLKLEKEYKELYEATRGRTGKKARDLIENILTKSAENLGPQLLNHLGAEQLNKMLNVEEEYERPKKDKDGNNILGKDGYPIMEKKKRKVNPIYANNKKKDK